MAGPSPAAADLLDLAEKYRTLAALRSRRDAQDDTAGVTARATLRALASRYPGCLRELDTLGPVELARRAQVTADAAASPDPSAPPAEPWMTWIWSYHRLMSAALAMKRVLGRGPLPAAGDLAELAAQASAVAGWPLDAGFVAAVARPAQRRIGVVVLQQLGMIHGVPAEQLARALFPRRRPPPYSLG